MAKTNYPALVGTLAITAALMGGGLWYLNRTSPGLLGGGNTPSSGSPTAPRGQTQITLLGDTFSGYSTFRNSAFQEALGESGLTLQYRDEFDQGTRAASLAQGDADLIVTTLDQFLQQQPQGQIVGLIDRTVGADAVVLNTPQYPDLKSLVQLTALAQQAKTQGTPLKLAFAGDTPSEYLALVLDTKFEALNLSDFEVLRVEDASDAWALMQDPSQNLVVAVLWEPFVTQARQQGYTVVLSSEDAPGSIVDVMVASERLIQSRPEVIATLLENYYRRIDINVRDASQLQAQIAEDGDLSAVDAGAVLQGIDFFTAAEAQTWMADGTLQRRIEATAAVLVLSGRLNGVPSDPASLFVEDFLVNAARNTETLIELVRADNPELADRLAGGNQRAITVPEVTADEVTATDRKSVV